MASMAGNASIIAKTKLEGAACDFLPIGMGSGKHAYLKDGELWGEGEVVRSRPRRAR